MQKSKCKGCIPFDFYILHFDFTFLSQLSDDSYNTGQKPLPDGTKLKYNLQYLDFSGGFKWHSQESGLIRYYVEVPVITWGFTVQRRGEIKAGDIDTRKEDIAKDVSAKVKM